MNIVRFIEPVTVSFKKSAGGITTVFEAGRDYVIATQQLDRICQDENVKARLYKVTRLEPRLEPFHVAAKKPGPQSVLFYNGSGGYGDQILSWPVVKWLSTQGYEVHVMSDPGNQCCWYNFPWVKTIQTAPIPYEQFKLFTYHFMMEHVSNLDEHQDQQHPVDAMFVKMGVDPKSIGPEQKAIEPTYTWLEQQTPRTTFTDKRLLGIFQLTSANTVRCLQPNDAAFLLWKLAAATPEIHWLAVYDEFNNKAYAEALKCRECGGAKIVYPAGITPSVKDGVVIGLSGSCAPMPEGTPVEAMAPAAMAQAAQAQSAAVPCKECNGTGLLLPNIQPYTSPNLRDLWALTKFRACVVVAPDSMMIHVAGCQSVPCVGLWGPVAPPNRVGYYKNHFAIFHRNACPHAPCFSYLADFPKYCPPRPPKRTVCEVVAAVTPQEVIDAVKKIKR